MRSPQGSSAALILLVAILCMALLFTMLSDPSLVTAQTGESEMDGIFSEIEGVPPPSPGVETLASRFAGIDFGHLDPSLESVSTPLGVDEVSRLAPRTVTLNLFDDATFTGRIEHVEPTASGYAFWGGLDGVELGTMTMVVNGSVVVGTVRTPQAVYTIRTAGNGVYIIRQIDESSLLPFGEPQSSPPTRPRSVSAQRDDGSEIDVMVVYTPTVKHKAGGRAGAEALIDLFVAETNQALTNSEVSYRIRLVSRQETEYIEDGNSFLDLDRLAGDSDGYMDYIHDLRDLYAADFVHLLVSRSDNVCGVANGLSGYDEEGVWQEAAFGLTVDRCGGAVFAHELGHNMGLAHDRYQVLKNEWRTDSIDGHNFGYVNQQMFRLGAPESARWRTIMAYGNQCWDYAEENGLEDFGCPRVLYFSNPDVTLHGDPLGVPVRHPSRGMDGPAYAARTLNANRDGLANHRQSSTSTPKVVLTLAPYWLAENGGSSTVAAALNRPSSADTTVTVSASRPDAVALSANGTLTIPAGQTTSTGVVTLTGIDNGEQTGDVSVTVSATATNTSGVDAPDPVELAVADDETTPVVALSLSSSEIIEIPETRDDLPLIRTFVTATLDNRSSAATELTISASPAESVIVEWYGDNDAPTLIIPAGQAASDASVAIIAADDDVFTQTRKRVTVSGTASNPQGVTGPRSVTLTIIDRDAPVFADDSIEYTFTAGVAGARFLPKAEYGNEPLTYSISPVPSNDMTFSPGPPARIETVATSAVAGPTSYTLTATDAQGDTDTMTVTVTVRAPICPDSAAISGYAGSGIVADCEALLASRDALRGDEPPNWSERLPMDEWQRVDTDDDRVVGIFLEDLGLNGSIPSELGNLTSLRDLYLFENQLNGAIPPELGNLANLEALAISANQLTGEIPTELGNLTNLRELSLWGNRLTGQIPYSLVNLTKLERLWLAPNDFTGCIPEALYNVPDNDLQYLDLPDCDGPPPPVECLHDCQLLLGIKDTLLGDGDAQLNWAADLPISNWTGVEVDSEQQVTHLKLPESGLNGSIPLLLGDLHSLRELNLQKNSLTGEIPAELGKLTDLTRLDVGINRLSGEIPADLGSLARLEDLSLQGNQLTGEVPAWMGDFTNMRGLWLGFNQLEGSIPPQLGNLSSLERLHLGGNTQMTGSIPHELGNLDNLRQLWLGDGIQLSGEIPSELGNLSNLEVLDLGGDNDLSTPDGGIPAWLENKVNLRYLHLDGNLFTGEIPAWLGGLKELETLSLHNNQLTGTIPPELGNLANLTFLAIPGNHLTGEIPPELGDLSNLEELVLSGNQLEGNIPSELANLANLSGLWLNDNQLTGGIPPELSNLANLERLLLARNQLSGEIPSELGNLTNLGYLRLAGNQFTGCIPEALRDVESNDFADTGLLFCDEEPSDPCTTPLTGDGPVRGIWDGACLSTNRSGSYAHFFTFTLSEPTDVTIALESEEEGNDTYLFLLGGRGEDGSVVRENDDHEIDCTIILDGDTDSCIAASLEAGSYTAEATTYDPGVTGGFTLTVSGLPDVVGPADCTDYSESPDLAEKVASGELPSVCDRLPAEPLTIQTLDDAGDYGGILRRFYLGPADGCNFFRVSRASLVRFSQDGFSLIPSVASGWEMSEDGREWTFYLREGMKWSDGDDFTADDFVWQYENVLLNEELTPDPPFFLRIGNEIGSIEKVDDTTVKFVFPQPNFLFAEIAAQADEACYGSSRNVPWAPSHYMQQFHIDHNPDVEQEAQDAAFESWAQYYDVKTQYNLNPEKPTIAPWMYTNPLGDQVVMSERNPYFWAVDEAGNQLPYLDGIRLTLVENTEIGTLMAAQGDIDMQGRHIRLDQYVPLRDGRADGGYTVLTWPTFGGTDVAFFFNMSLPGATGDAIRTEEFRQALSLAIDRESIKEIMFLGFGEIRQNVPPPGHSHYPGADIAKLRIEYDVDEANRLLDSVFPDRDDEGFRLSNGERIVMSVTVTESFAPWPDAAQVVGRAWEAVGVKTEVDQATRSQHFTRWQTNEWAVMVWNEDTTSSTFSRIHTRAPNGIAFHGPGCAAWLIDPDDPEAFPCAQESLDLLDMHRRGPGLPEAERNALGQEIYRTVVENQYSIGIVGLSPMVQGVVVKKNTLHNVPDAAANDWTFRTPNSAFPEQWYFGPEIESVVALPAALSVGTGHACALDLNGVISCQGVDDSAQVTGVPTSGIFAAISVGERHSCAIDLDGRVHCWGSDEHGQVSGRPTSGEFIAVGAGARHTCAIDARGSVHCWGSDDHEQSSPPTEGVFVAVGAGDSHTCGLLSDGTLERWGVFRGN